MRTFALVALFAAVASAEYTQAYSSAKVGEVLVILEDSGVRYKKVNLDGVSLKNIF